jgi:hypothetical protein
VLLLVFYKIIEIHGTYIKIVHFSFHGAQKCFSEINS